MIFFTKTQGRLPGLPLKSYFYWGESHGKLISQIWQFFSAAKIFRIMKLTFILLTAALMNVHASGFSQKVTYSGENVQLETVFSTIKKQTGFGFFYKQGLLKDSKPVTINVVDAELSEVLKFVFKDQPLDYTINNETILVSKRNNPVERIIAPMIQVGGIVIDKNGEALIGVSVKIKGTTMGVSTDINGHFSINIPDGSNVLVFSYIGFITKEVSIDGRSTVDVQLIPSPESIQEVIVVGYGTQRKSDLTGAISSVTAKEIQGQAFSNINQALQGKVAGAEFTTTSGEPGAAVQIRVRGQGTFGKSGPLYVVDGVPIGGEIINSINPNDIESINVLKDASASAIYGSRAANGVILITTKMGSVGKPLLSYNGYYGIQSVSKNRHLPMANSQLLAAVVNEADKNGGFALQAAFNDPENLKTDINWQEAAFPNAPMQDHSINIAGGSESAKYSVSGGVLDQQGSMVFSSFTRYSTRVNSQFKIGEKITIGESIMMSRSKGLNLGFGTNLDLAYLLGGSPTMKIYKPQYIGGYAGPNSAETGINNRANIIGRRDLQRHYTWNNNILGSVYSEYKILPELKYRLNLGLRNGLDNSKYYLGVFQMDNHSNNVRSLSMSRNESYEYLIENTLSFDKKIKDFATVSLLAGYTQQNSISNTMSGSKSQFPSDDLQVFNAGTGPFTLGGNEAEWALRSYLGRANITLFDKYLFTATIRRDGSSRFGEVNRYGNFPSFAAGWNVDRENFMKGLAAISSLKIRGSWGQLGNQELGNYENQTTVSTVPQYVLGSGQTVVSAATALTMGNPALKWETTTQTNFGLDIGLLGNSLTFSADYWIKDTNGILLRTPISAATGFYQNSGPYQNAAAVQNSGFEFLLGYSKAGRQLNYGLTANLSTVKNEITGLGGVPNIINLVSNVYSFGTNTITEVGRPMSTYYGYIFDGIFQNQNEVNSHAKQSGSAPGEMRFKDVNGDGQITADDRTYIGDPFPNFIYGFSGNASYKNFDLNIGFQGVQGKQLYNSQRAYLESMTGEFGQMATVVDRWRGEGTSNMLPKPLRGSRSVRSLGLSKFVEDASYLRLQSIQIGYSMPSRWSSRLGINKLRAFFNGQNLLTFTDYINYNPDILGGSGYNDDSRDPLALGVDMGAVPIPAVYQFGLQISF